MPTYRCQVNIIHSSNLPRLRVVNTFYLDVDQLITHNAQDLADDAAELWATYRAYPAAFTSVRVALYNMGHVEPREPVAEATHATTTGQGTPGAPEVACCLSYYADRNLPRNRGRMYIGPWFADHLRERPETNVLDELDQLANGLSGLGGVDVQWAQWSSTLARQATVTNWWIDDEWDVIRSRGHQPSARRTGIVDG